MRLGAFPVVGGGAPVFGATPVFTALRVYGSNL